MGSDDRPLIVGAGPVGLAAALFLARRGIRPRLIEMRDHPSRESRALAVNPRTLDLLEPTGVAASILEIGGRIRGAVLHRGPRVAARVSIAGAHPKHPYMVALSQATTERLLEDALRTHGVEVERSVKLVACRPGGGAVEAVLERPAEHGHESVRVPWLIAADGSHSTARKQLNVGFPGSALKREWHLADIALRTTLDEDHAHVLLLPGGVFVFLIRVIDPALEGERDAPIWRVIANHTDPVSLIEGAQAVGEPLWSSSFHIAHRVCETFARDGVYFAGDAAHIHSPIGARGMNLGIEDAWVLAELTHAGKLDRYDAIKRPMDAGVVRRVAFVSRIVAGEPAVLRVVRALAFPGVLKIPMFQRRMRAVVSGLDHDLPKVTTA